MLRIYTTYLGLKNRAERLLSEDRGATAIEYGLIAAGIAVAIVAVVYGVGSDLINLFTDVQTNLQQRGG
ncbi:MAG: Flp family type IVb pilin [Rhodospirillales bacterium]|nr:MAG: Flp family type IVb pilin [Rhodospirillales bacterium]